MNISKNSSVLDLLHQSNKNKADDNIILFEIKKC